MEQELFRLLAGPRTRRVEVRGEVWTLKVVTALALLEARREAEGLAREGAERALCSNACLLARALVGDGERRFPSGRAVLEALTPGEIQQLAEQLGRLNREGNPSPEAGEQEIERLKKA